MDKYVRLLIVLLMALFSFQLFAPALLASPVIHPTDILIDVGHGGIDGGTSFDGLLEKDINLAVAKKLRQHLTRRGFHVALTRNGDYALSEDNRWLPSRSRHTRDLAQRGLIVNELRPKVLISLHVNWSSKPSRTGALVLYRLNQPSYILANIVQDSLNRVYGIHMPPFYSNKFYLLNRAPCPAVIIEMGFISNPSDREMLTIDVDQEKLAEAISSALWEYMLLFNVN